MDKLEAARIIECRLDEASPRRESDIFREYNRGENPILSLDDALKLAMEMGARALRDAGRSETASDVPKSRRDGVASYDAGRCPRCGMPHEWRWSGLEGCVRALATEMVRWREARELDRGKS